MKIELTETEIHYLRIMLETAKITSKFFGDQLRTIVEALSEKLKEASELPKK